ncbi:MAG: tripartite tricarboxylate transporter substrate binding protein [Deltaproteobacteria bacterium]|nr:tripartite tricarboxylate transporter substrate binding protein [Deltaproteobacteria bacterium]
MGKKAIVLTIALLAVGAMLLGGAAQAADTFPNKPVNIYVGFPPGGVAGNSARAIGTPAAKFLGQPTAIMHKPGAGGTLAVSYVSEQEPDGYTLINAGTSTLATAMFTKGVKWGPNDFTMILGYTAFNFALVTRADAPWKNFDEWVDYVRKHPGFKYATYGALGTMHLFMEWLAKELKLDMVPVHFKGDSPAVAALLGGHLQIYCGAGGQAPHVKAGTLRTLLQISGEPKDANAKDVPRLSQKLPKAPVELFTLPIGIFGPKGMSASVAAKLTEAFTKAAKAPECAKALQQMNMNVKIVGPEELHKNLVAGQKQFGALIKELKLKRK